MKMLRNLVLCGIVSVGCWQSLLAIAPMPETLDREACLREAATVTREAAPDARTLAFASSRYVVYASDGTSTTWIEWWAKAFTEDGADELRDVPLYYKKGFSEGAFQLAEVIRADGSILPIDVTRHVTDVSCNSGNSANIYDETSRNLVLTVPQLEKGDTLHLVLARHTSRPRVPNTYTDFATFESMESPTPYAELTVIAPKDLPLQSVALLNEVPGTMKTSRETLANGSVKHRWVAQNVPQSFPEDNMPEESTQVQRVVISTFPSWEALSQWYWELCLPHLEVTANIAEKVNSLTEGKTQEEQIAALFGFVAQEIRYMGIIAEDTAPGYEPHDVSLTFDNRYGVCRDKGALLVAMLREAGFKAFPVLINAGSRRDKEVALPYFNHAIVAIDLGDKEYKLIDPTDDTARAELPAYLSGCTYVVARPEGDTLRETPVPNPQDHLMDIVTDATLDDSGTLSMTATLHFNGINDNIYRSIFIKNPPDKQRERLDGLAKRVIPGAELVSFSYTPEDAKDITQPFCLKMTVKVDQYAVPNEEGNTLVRLPYFSHQFGLVNFLFGGLDQPTRKYDWEITSPCAVREVLTLHGFNSLGEAHLLPDDPVLKVNGASYNVTCKRDTDADTITLTRALELSNKLYSPENYRELRRFLERMRYFEKLRPLFVKKMDQHEDATVLTRLQETTLNADGSVQRHHLRKVKVNTFQGKRSQGEVKLWHSPAWQALELNVAEVIAENGDCISVTEKEINLLDSDGAALSPRYPTLKQTVISLPAVEVGAVTHVDWTITDKDTRPFCETISFGSAYFTAEETYTLKVPHAEAENLRIAERNFDHVNVTRTVSDTDTHKVYTWTVRDLPGTKHESSMPSTRFLMPTLYVAHRQAAAHHTLPLLFEKVAERLDEARPQTNAAAKELLKTISRKDTEARLIAIQDFISQRIRTLGPAWYELPFGTVSTPDETLTAGYGNRLDTLVLWLALLDEANIDAELVFADNVSLAYAETFNTLLAAREAPRWTRWTRPYVRLSDGRLLGDGEACDPIGATVLRDCGLITAGGRILYHTEEADVTKTERKVRVVVDAGGSAVLTSNTWHYGLNAGDFRRNMREMTPEVRRRTIAEIANALATGAEPFSEYLTETNVYPAHERLAVAAKHYAVRQGQYLSIPVPRVVLPIYNLRGTNRVNPIWQEEREGVVAEVDVWLPRGSEIISCPEPFQVTLPGGGTYEMTLETEVTPHVGLQRLTYTSRLDAAPALLDSWYFNACVELDRRLSAPEMSTIVVRLPE